MVTVQFENVGRDRMTWVVHLRSLDPVDLLRSVKGHRALRSSDIDFHFDEATQRGNIYAGDRLVGFYSVIPTLATTAAVASTPNLRDQLP